MKRPSRYTLSTLQVAVSIITMHYGLGMLVGTGQDIALYGPIGMAYAVSTGLGTIATLPFTKFYWQRFVPLWELFKKRYGQRPAELTAFLSSFWMIGVVGSYLIGGAAAAQLFGLPYWLAMLILAGAMYGLSIIRIGALSRIFFYMLLVSSLLLVIVFFKVGFIWFPRAAEGFVMALPLKSSTSAYGIVINTVLVTVIGMDFHQFIVRGKSLRSSQVGIMIAAVVLLLLSFLIGGTILGALPSLPARTAGLQILPQILATSGGSLLGNLGLVFVLPILFVAVGSGSGIIKILAQALRDLLGDRQLLRNQKSLNACVLIAALLIALTSGSVIQLIVAFYATYLGAVFVPFLVFAFERKLGLRFDEETMFAAMVSGFFATLSVYVVHTATNVFGDVSLAMIVAGASISSATLVFYKLLESKAAVV